MRRVVVTGLGPVSSIGIGLAPFREALRAGRSGASPISSFDAAKFPRRLAAEVRDFDPHALLRQLDPDDWGRASLFAAAAARLAMHDAGLSPGAPPSERTAVVIGTTSGESQVLEEMTRALMAGGFGALSSKLMRRLPTHRLAEAAAEELGARGEALTLTTACSASNYALGYAYDLIASGEYDVVIAGGADAVCCWAHAGFLRLGAIAESRCAPFDRDRDGILVGEGGASLLLEAGDHAEARGARPYAEMLGYGLNCDAAHVTAPNAESIAACMRMALANAAVAPSEIDWVCAHGTGTPTNDAVEAAAIRAVFGDAPPPMSSIKSMLGHTMGAASAFGAIASVLSIKDGFLPPTINWRTPDSDLAGIDPIANMARPAQPRHVQNNGFAFGGNNAIVVFGAMEASGATGRAGLAAEL